MRVWLLGMLLLAGCANKYTNSTFFLKEDDKIMYNFKGDLCLQSGEQVIKITDEHYQLITFFSNCDVRIERKMKQWEPEQWGIPPKKAYKLDYLK